MIAQPGILAIWNDVKPGREADFDSWFQGEHLVERLGVPGFLYGRRHEAISGAKRFFNFYVVEGPEVLTSKPYLERARQSDADDANGHVGGVHQHEPHRLPARRAARWLSAAPMP